jgi:hypothetical protein
MKHHLGQFFKEPEDVDTIIKYIANFDEYGIPIHDGGSSFIIIAYCPWYFYLCINAIKVNKHTRHLQPKGQKKIIDPVQTLYRCSYGDRPYINQG